MWIYNMKTIWRNKMQHHNTFQHTTMHSTKLPAQSYPTLPCSTLSYPIPPYSTFPLPTKHCPTLPVLVALICESATREAGTYLCEPRAFFASHSFIFLFLAVVYLRFFFGFSTLFRRQKLTQDFTNPWHYVIKELVHTFSCAVFELLSHLTVWIADIALEKIEMLSATHRVTLHFLPAFQTSCVHS